MEGMRYRKIDPERLRELVASARARGDCSDPELGAFVSDLCKIVLSSGCFRGYTEDWQLDMFGDACLAVFSAMETADTGRNLFSYFYTVAANACKRSLKRRVRDTVPLDDRSQARAVEPFCLKDRRRLLRGLVEVNERKVVPLARMRKMAKLERAVGRAVERALAEADGERIAGLVGISRRNREKA